jgi:hypothetical protein
MSPKSTMRPLRFGRDVGGEDLDGRKAGLDRLADLAGQIDRQRALDHDVLRVIAGAMTFPVRLALFDRVAHGGALRGAGEVDHRGGAAMHGGFADDIGRLGQAGAAVGVGQNAICNAHADRSRRA